MPAVMKVNTREDDCPLSECLRLERLKKKRHGLLESDPVE